MYQRVDPRVNPVTLDREKFTMSLDEETLVAEMSDFQLRGAPSQVQVGSVVYDRRHPDRSGDDIAGWNYVARGDGSPPKLLLIND
jgi:hypothetical protein